MTCLQQLLLTSQVTTSNLHTKTCIHRIHNDGCCMYRPSSFLQCYPSWRGGYQEAHDRQPDIPWGLTYDEDMITTYLQTGIVSNTSEGADEAVGPSSDKREALGDPAAELVCDVSQLAT